MPPSSHPHTRPCVPILLLLPLFPFLSRPPCACTHPSPCSLLLIPPSQPASNVSAPHPAPDALISFLLLVSLSTALLPVSPFLSFSPCPCPDPAFCVLMPLLILMSPSHPAPVCVQLPHPHLAPSASLFVPLCPHYPPSIFVPFLLPLPPSCSRSPSTALFPLSPSLSYPLYPCPCPAPSAPFPSCFGLHIPPLPQILCSSLCPCPHPTLAIPTLLSVSPLCSCPYSNVPVPPCLWCPCPQPCSSPPYACPAPHVLSCSVSLFLSSAVSPS